MRKIYTFIILGLAVVSCEKTNPSGADESIVSNVSNGYTIKGELVNCNSNIVYLRQLIGRNAILKDSSVIGNDGKFEFSGKVEIADFYQLNIPGSIQYVFILDNSDLNFSADIFNFEETKNLEGSNDTKVFYKFTDQVNQRNAERGRLNKLAINANETADKATLDSLTKVYNKGETESIRQIKLIINANTNSFISAVGTQNFIDPALNYEYMDSISSVLNKKLPESRYVQNLVATVNSLRKISIGESAPNITQKSPNGNAISLRDLKGKYVLVDFWASWCRPCRAENPKVVKLYEKFKNKNFEILGVSLDKDDKRWKQAIESDGLSWPQVSDLNGWKSQPAAKYNVKSIPATFLIDPNGIIIAKDLRGEALEKKLEEVLG